MSILWLLCPYREGEGRQGGQEEERGKGNRGEEVRLAEGKRVWETNEGGEGRT